MVERLADHLGTWAGADPQRMAVAETVRIITDTCRDISVLVADGSLGQDLGAAVTENIQGETQKALDELANRMLIDACRGGPVAAVASEEDELPVPANPKAGLLVAFDPLDGSSNIDINVSIGTIFSILPIKPGVDPASVEAFLQRGRNQLAAGYVLYGPQTTLVMSLGQGTVCFTLDRRTNTFLLSHPPLSIPAQTRNSRSTWRTGAIGRAPFRLTSTSASTARRDRGARTPTCAGSRRWSRTATVS